MKIFFAILVLHLAALTGVVLGMLAILFAFRKAFPPLITRYLFDVSGGPLGPITFTAMSTRSINIQVDKGPDIWIYHTFTIRRDNWQTACNIPVNAILNDCTDNYARQGRNHYRIGADFQHGGMVPRNFYANTLQHNRTHFLVAFLIIAILATEHLNVEAISETSISVIYGVIGGQMVARSAKAGRFFGGCDWYSCTVNGLRSGFIYEIWVRTCSGSGPTQCMLRAWPTQIVSYPKRRCFVKYSSLRACRTPLWLTYFYFSLLSAIN